VRLDYGLVDWTALSREEGRGGIRLGRIKTAYGFYNTTRDVPFHTTKHHSAAVDLFRAERAT
jgi:hypothetical protein